jgi:hypothetical protein
MPNATSVTKVESGPNGPVFAAPHLQAQPEGAEDSPRDRALSSPEVVSPVGAPPFPVVTLPLVAITGPVAPSTIAIVVPPSPPDPTLPPEPLSMIGSPQRPSLQAAPNGQTAPAQSSTQPPASQCCPTAQLTSSQLLSTQCPLSS